MIFQKSPKNQAKIRVGIIGTGFIAAGLLGLLTSTSGFAVSRVLTRRPRGSVTQMPEAIMTRSIDELIHASDIVVECSGDVVHAAEVVGAAMESGRRVVTMNSEFQVTVGSYFAERGYLTEAEGDQPGSIAALAEEAVEMGFLPLVYGNIKGFLNHEPTKEEMFHWSMRNGISLAQVTSFTDGTKLQIEQALVANGMGAGIAKKGLVGPVEEPLDISAGNLARIAKSRGCSLSDYVLNRSLPAGVFVVCEHPSENPDVLRYLKLGDGPFYTLMRTYHLCHLEIVKTLRRVVAGGDPLLNNSAIPTINVAAIAKKDLAVGSVIPQAVGGFTVRGEAVSFADEPNAVPVGLLKQARLARAVEKGQTLVWDDVEIPDSLALRAALVLRRQMNGTVEAIREARVEVS
jgi:predicted homoserine dehydrogenase-like protein